MPKTSYTKWNIIIERKILLRLLRPTSQRSDLNYSCAILMLKVLGPILFLLYIDDVTLICPGSVTSKLFADDLKIYSNVEVSSESLSTTISQLEAWCRVWQLHVNVSKTFVLHLGLNNPHFAYSFHNNLISATESTRDLGVEIDTVLSFDHHISKVVAKASSRVGTLFRGFSSRDPVLLRKAFVTYIRPILEYASNVWSPTCLNI